MIENPSNLSEQLQNLDEVIVLKFQNIINTLNTKLDTTAKADSARIADSANSVAWSNVTGTEKVRTTDTPITMNDFGGSIDLGMIG